MTNDECLMTNSKSARGALLSFEVLSFVLRHYFPPRVDLALFDSRLIWRTLARAFIVKSVLFVCTGNICRSPIAEGLFCRMLGNRKDIEVTSAGVHAVRGQPPSLYATQVCEDEGVDISQLRSQPLTEIGRASCRERAENYDAAVSIK